MKDVVTPETHVRKHRAVVPAAELERIIADAICKQLGRGPVSPIGPGVSFQVLFEDETAGSPAYKTGTKAIVTITEDLKFVLPGVVVKQEGER
ncbi:hypothetical protein [Sphingomonas sp. TREG-RG-20F-R18-01]|uniref:hypothetical protein n=1 Tax=Sphingomonas sp. TREG-RG-20F-R18-01 TaxID=2914982 RepID=UPI001F5A5615|nr:hypothetical protein [Sphingomonas sp. TREG-RG-20F-R18-01]